MTSQQHPPASRRQPHPPAVSWKRMPAYERPKTKIQTRMRRASQPSSAAPAPPHQANDAPQPAKQKIPNNPNLSEPILNQQFVGPGFPKTRSANLGFEIRGFSCPSPPALPPQNPTQPNSPNRRTKRTQFPPPATTQSPSPAVARPRPACRPTPTQPQLQSAKIELPNRPNLAEPIWISVLAGARP